MENNTKDYYIFDTTLIVDDQQGILGTDDDHSIEDRGQIEVAIQLKIPKSLFKPIQVNVDIPPEFLQSQTIQTTLKDISIPVVVGTKSTELKLTESLEYVDDRPGTGIIALLRRAIFGEKKMGE